MGLRYSDARWTRQPEERGVLCDCGRNVRVVPSVLAQAPIVCGGCGKPFRIPETVGAAN